MGYSTKNKGQNYLLLVIFWRHGSLMASIFGTRYGIDDRKTLSGTIKSPLL